MDQPAEPVAVANRGPVSRAERNHLRRGVGRAQLERSVGSLAVVVVDVLAQDALAQGAHEALGALTRVRTASERCEYLSCGALAGAHGAVHVPVPER